MLKTMNIQHLCTPVVTNMYVLMRIFVAEMIYFCSKTQIFYVVLLVLWKKYITFVPKL